MSSGEPIQRPVSVGAYSGSADRVTFNLQAPAWDINSFGAAWRAQGSSLVFRFVKSSIADDAVFFRILLQTHPWRKIA